MKQQQIYILRKWFLRKIKNGPLFKIKAEMNCIRNISYLLYNLLIWPNYNVNYKDEKNNSLCKRARIHTGSISCKTNCTRFHEIGTWKFATTEDWKISFLQMCKGRSAIPKSNGTTFHLNSFSKFQCLKVKWRQNILYSKI